MNNEPFCSSSQTSTDEYAWYLKEVEAIPPLSPTEEHHLLQQIATAPQSAQAKVARTRLIEAHLHLALHIARRYQLFGVALPDLIQEGNLALVKAAHDFAPQRRRSFRTFATQRLFWHLARVIAAHLREHTLMQHDLPSYAPLHPQVLDALVQGAIEEDALAVDLPQARLIPLETVENEDACEYEQDQAYGLSSCPHIVRESEAEAPEASVLAQECRDCLLACVATLPEKHYQVLMLRYLLDATYTLAEVGQTLAVSRERVRQLEAQALRTLRHPRSSHKLRSLL